MLELYDVGKGTKWVRKDGIKNPIVVTDSIIGFMPAIKTHSPQPIFLDEITGEKFTVEVSDFEEFKFFYEEIQ